MRVSEGIKTGTCAGTEFSLLRQKLYPYLVRIEVDDIFKVIQARNDGYETIIPDDPIKAFQTQLFPSNRRPAESFHRTQEHGFHLGRERSLSRTICLV